nr:amino acid permease [Spirochaeta isovalerica]
MNLFHLTMLGLGMMIGAGVFLGIGNSIHHAGPGGVILTFAFNGVLALCTAMSYAELSSAIPRAGGAFNFAKLAFGSHMSFLAGWMEWFASSVAGSMYAVTFSIYTMRYLDTLGFLPAGLADTLIKPVAVAIALLFLIINYRGASETGKVGAIMTLGQTLFLVLLAIIGIYVAIKEPHRLLNFQPFLPKGWGRLLMTMGFTYVAFEGFEVIAQAGDEAINPRKNLPKAMILSVSVAALTYIGVAFATIVSVQAGHEGIDIPWEWIGSFGEKGFGEAVSRLIPAGNILLTIAVIFASTSALNSTVFSATRASYALGRDELLPPVFAKISPKRKTPVGALTLTGVIIVFVASFLPTMDVASSASIMFLFLFFVVNLSVIIIRRKLGDEMKYGYIMPLFPLFPIIAIIMQAVLAIWLVEMSLVAWIIAPLWIISGSAIYFLYAKSHMKPSEVELEVIEEDHSETNGRYREQVMMAVANPENVPLLAEVTRSLVPDNEALVEFLHMVPVPGAVALSDAEKFLKSGKEAIDKAEELLSETYSTASTIRYCRNISRGIITTVKERHSKTLIMGWHGKPGNKQFSLGSTLDPVICGTPGNVIVVKGDVKPKKIKTVLVPLFGGLNDALAMKAAERLLPDEGGEITAFYSNRAKMRPGHIYNIMRNIVDNPDVIIHEMNTHHARMENLIVEEAKFHDLLVLGISEPRTSRLGFPSLSERIAARVPSPMLLVKTNSILRKLAKRLF